MTSTVNPLEAAEQWLAPVRLDTTSVLFVIGCGEGHVLDALDRRGWNGQVVALEPDAASASKCLNRKAVRDWQVAGRLTVLAGPDYTGLDKAIAALPLTTEKPVMAGNPDVARAHREACVHAARTVSRAWFGARANDEARKQNSGRYLLNTLRNLQPIAAEGDVSALAGAFAGIPALVVAAGPSLDKNLPNIVALRDRALVIAVDTALRPLLESGVQPDFVVAVDPSEANACHLTDLPPCPETHFVAEGSIDPEALRHFEGRTFFFRVSGHHPWPWLRGLGLDRHSLRAWGSVLTTAFDLALQMGCGPVVFAGADLSYTDGRPYARGTSYEDGWRREQAWGQPIEATWAKRLGEWPEILEAGVGSGIVRTAPHLRSFRDWIVTAAGRAAGRVIINATEGGILVGDSINQSTLVDALGSLPSVPLSVRQSVAARRGAQPAISVGAPTIGEDTRIEWVAFANVPAESIDAALQPMPPVPVIVPAATAATAVPTVAATPVPASPHPGLSDADAIYLSDLAQREMVRLVVLADPAQDLLADLRQQCDTLTQNDALVIVDEVGIGVGAQVRATVDAILCKRPDVWLEYRRFVDHASRLTVLRSGAALAMTPEGADAAKRDPAHQVVADSLVPLIVSQLAPHSVVDVGPGAGYWLQALRSNGITDVHGIAAVAPLPDQGRRFDLCLCLEVAQHLSPVEQDELIEACTRLSDAVAFSSAPPGTPGASSHQRPLPYWADKFWRHGYVLDDCLRPLLQAHWDSPRTVFDCLVMFRRMPSGPAALREWALSSAARTHDLYMQGVWWSVLAGDRATVSTQPEAAPLSPRQWWPIPSRRMLASAPMTRLFRFRTDAARWYLTHPASDLEVREDGHPLAKVPAVAELSATTAGGWARWRDEVTLRASDGTDPRSNGRRYTIGLPAHVAWAESQPLRDTLNSSL